MGYSDDKKSAFPHTQLEKEIFHQIEKADSRSISFADFMEQALYHPEHGYYSKPWEREIGRGGDFFTSVSVGDTFGFLIAHAIEREWRDHFGSVENFAIVEQGAHDGQLAIDIVTALQEICPQFFEKGGSYHIIEPRENIRNWLSDRFETTGSVHRINPVGSYAEVGANDGIFLANELLDAFPVHRFYFENGVWQELRVTVWNDEFAWQPTEIAEGSALAAAVSRLGSEFPDGYTTEICLETRNWLAESAFAFSNRGLYWIFDYGFEDDDYFASHRTTGTLQCYRKHEKSENPFQEIGETDLTTHVNFSQLMRDAASLGMTGVEFSDQHHFLIRAAEKWLREIDGQVPDSKTAKRIRQFQTLTHPGLMGQSFKLAEFRGGFAEG